MADGGVPDEVTHLLSQDAIDSYASLSGDFNPLHVDPAYTARTSFGGTIAHGPLSSAHVRGALQLAREG